MSASARAIPGTELILRERARQIDAEEWTAEHDDAHDLQQLQRAAESYWLSAHMTLRGFKSFRAPESWPWHESDWKPFTPIRDLTKAGALWLAEIDRLKRLGKGFPFPTILRNLANKVEECAQKIDQLQKEAA